MFDDLSSKMQLLETLGSIVCLMVGNIILVRKRLHSRRHGDAEMTV